MYFLVYDWAGGSRSGAAGEGCVCVCVCVCVCGWVGGWGGGIFFHVHYILLILSYHQGQNQIKCSILGSRGGGDPNPLKENSYGNTFFVPHV